MNKLMGIINDTQDDYFLKDLTLHRTLATVPFASRYRLVDFVLSNMVNSGINNVGILVKNKDCSLINYLGAAKEWGLDRKNGGLFFLSTANKGLNKGTVLDLVTLYNNLNYLEKSKEEYVLLATSQMICNMNYQKVLQAHISSKSDITLIYQEGKLAETKGAYLNIKNQDVIGLNNGYKQYKGNKKGNLFLNMYILKKDLLIELIKDSLIETKNSLFIDSITTTNNFLV